ncbi:MAG TPA: LLM class flavin-dependent oxidoreductase [Chloroflexota bacterium]
MAGQLILNAFVRVPGHHAAAWRHPSSTAQDGTDLATFVKFAQTAERGAMHSLFVADSPGGGRDILSWNGGVEPLTLLAALAARTEHIGLIGTSSTTFSEPYALAREFASLDHLSAGRAAWNIVTSSNLEAAYNFSTEPSGHAERYVRATEFVEVVTALWDSWEDDAQVYDQAANRQVDFDKVHAIDHAGVAYRVRGPLNSPRTPQGWPLLVQAGSSEDGKDFAARFAEAIFTVQQTVDEAKRFSADVKARAASFGRDPSTVKILPGLCFFIGSTESEAKRVQSELDDLAVPADGPVNLGALQFIGVDLSGFPLDEPLPFHLLPSESEFQGSRSRWGLLIALARREQLTIRQLLRKVVGGRGHFTFAGTPEQVADLIETWFTQGAADGFNVMPPLHQYLETFVDEVIPILQRRGIFHAGYEGKTLRENYGVPRPASRYAARPTQTVAR